MVDRRHVALRKCPYCGELIMDDVTGSWHKFVCSDGRFRRR